MSPLIKFLSDDDLKRIHSASLRVLERTGIEIRHGQALRMLEGAGARVDYQGERAKLSGEMIEQYVRKAPQVFTLAARDPACDVLLKPDGDIYFRSIGGPDHMIDIDTGEYRKILTSDVKDWARLIDGLDNLSYGMGIYPNDAPMATRDVHLLEIMLENTAKHVHLQPYCARNIEYMIELASLIVGSKKKLAERPIISLFVSAVTPLRYSANAIDILLTAGQHGIPVMLNSTPIAGATGPITLAGSVVLLNAEILAGVVISQLAHPGAPIVYAPRPLTFDMRTCISSCGHFENGMVSAAAVQLVRKYYNLPTDMFGPSTDSKTPDDQAILEKAYNALFPALAGANIVSGAGMLESAGTVSPVQLVIDNDTMGMILRTLRGFRVDDDALSCDVIDRVGPGGHFLDDEHTLRYFKDEYFRSDIVDRHVRDIWVSEGAQDLRQKSHDKTKEILQKHQREPLDEDMVKELRMIVKEAQKRHGKNAAAKVTTLL